MTTDQSTHGGQPQRAFPSEKQLSEAPVLNSAFVIPGIVLEGEEGPKSPLVVWLGRLEAPEGAQPRHAGALLPQGLVSDRETNTQKSEALAGRARARLRGTGAA